MALEDGGFTREQISGTNTGVFIGEMNSGLCLSVYKMIFISKKHSVTLFFFIE
jgi:alpha-acetolactate decarboxylase